MDILEKIFGSLAKVKIMRIFMFNPGTAFDIRSMASHAKVSEDVARREVKVLEDICLIKRKSFHKSIRAGKGKNRTVKKSRVRGWILNDTFHYLLPLQNLLIRTSLLEDREIIGKFSRIGRIKLLIIAGIFIQDKESRVDLLVVGDGLKKPSMEMAVKRLESEVGKELSYSFFETSDFQYRYGMYDKLIRDILDYPHRKLINKLGVAEQK